MSYILDALRKAEQARPIGKVPTIETLHPAAPPPAKARWWPWAAVGVGLVNAAALAWIFSAPAVPTPTTAAAPPIIPVAPATAVTPRAASPATTPAQTVPGPSAVDPASSQSAPEAPLASAPASDRVSTAVPVPAAPVFQGPPTQPPAVAPPARVPRVARTPQADGLAVASPRVRTDIPASSEMRETEPKRPPVPVGAATVKDEVPAAFREAFPSVRLDALVYAESPAGRMAFIGGRRYAEGDSLDPQTRIEEITQEGVVLRHRGQRFLLR